MTEHLRVGVFTGESHELPEIHWEAKMLEGPEVPWDAWANRALLKHLFTSPLKLYR